MGIKNLRFQAAQQGAVIFKDDGKGGKTRIADRSEWTSLRVKKVEADSLLEALNWICIDQLDFFVDPQPTEKPDIVEVAIPGRFSSPLSEADISQIISDYKLLNEHYPNYSSLLKPGLDNKVTEVIVYYLYDKTTGEQAELPAWVARVIEIKRSK